MEDKLKNLFLRMQNAKKITSEALKDCDKDEIQNIVWIDAHLGFWLKDLAEILTLVSKEP